MSYNHKPTTDNGVRRISNLEEYVRLKTIHSNTALIGGKIILDGKEWNKEDYCAAFPKAELKYAVQQLDKTQVQNSLI